MILLHHCELNLLLNDFKEYHESISNQQQYFINKHMQHEHIINQEINNNINNKINQQLLFEICEKDIEVENIFTLNCTINNEVTSELKLFPWWKSDQRFQKRKYNEEIIINENDLVGNENMIDILYNNQNNNSNKRIRVN